MSKRQRVECLGASYLSLSALPPCGSMFDDPVEESTLKADIVPGFLAFNPFMAQYLLALGQELLVEHRIFHQLCGVFFRGFHYSIGGVSTSNGCSQSEFMCALTVALIIRYLPV
jgi:hypothetical protein